MDTSPEAVRLPFWEKLSDDEKELVRRSAAVRTFAKGEYLKGSVSSCLGMVTILSGSVRALMISEEGREVTLFRLGTGDACVLSASCLLTQITFETQMVAEETTQAMIVNPAVFARLMEENIEVRCYCYKLAAERSSAVIWVLQEILFAKFDRRLARFLLASCEKSGSMQLRMTREAIAQEVNTAREVVSRMLRRFCEDGLITVSGKTITVTDPEGLKKIL